MGTNFLLHTVPVPKKKVKNLSKKAGKEKEKKKES